MGKQAHAGKSFGYFGSLLDYDNEVGMILQTELGTRAIGNESGDPQLNPTQSCRQDS